MVDRQSGSKHVEVYDRGKRTSCFHAQVVRCQTDRELGAGWKLRRWLDRWLFLWVGGVGCHAREGLELCHRFGHGVLELTSCL